MGMTFEELLSRLTVAWNDSQYWLDVAQSSQQQKEMAQFAYDEFISTMGKINIEINGE